VLSREAQCELVGSVDGDKQTADGDIPTAGSSMTEKIAAVIDSFDEEGRQPANYVVELVDGGFEARVWDVALDRELILGTCETCGEAAGMVWAWSDQDENVARKQQSLTIFTPASNNAALAQLRCVNSEILTRKHMQR
jgi:hypothetical protein